MALVTAKEVSKAIKTDKFGFIGTFIGWLLMKVLKISTINKFYTKNKHLKDLDFLNAILDEFKIKFEIHEEDLKRLPKNGWAHHGLMLAYQNLNDSENVSRMEALIEKSWMDADFEIMGPKME